MVYRHPKSNDQPEQRKLKALRMVLFSFPANYGRWPCNRHHSAEPKYVLLVPYWLEVPCSNVIPHNWTSSAGKFKALYILQQLTRGHLV